MLMGVPGSFRMLFWAAAFIGLSVFAQGRSHAMEAQAPEKFAGAAEFAKRICAEQFVTFPRFVLSGQWLRNLQTAA